MQQKQEWIVLIVCDRSVDDWSRVTGICLSSVLFYVIEPDSGEYSRCKDYGLRKLDFSTVVFDSRSLGFLVPNLRSVPPSLTSAMYEMIFISKKTFEGSHNTGGNLSFLFLFLFVCFCFAAESFQNEMETESERLSDDDD